MAASEGNFIGVDVGTGSARAALVSSVGQVLDTCVRPIRTWNTQPNHYEQSSEDIWTAVCDCVKSVAKRCPKDAIKGIGFDATCSLVVLDQSMQPLTVSLSGENERNVILWMDHRAEDEARFINATKHRMLKYVGGSISLEMEIPKLLWLKKHLHGRTWTSAGVFLDLPDYLTYRATGCDSRSLCSVVCKWNYDAQEGSWCADYLNCIGLEELQHENFRLIGDKVYYPGTPIATGLSDEAANMLNLLPGTPVAASLIDAHAGALALLGCRNPAATTDSITSKMAIICGTSSCHMSLSVDPVLAPGIWGPYKHAIIPGLYLNEAGQSATGALLDFILQTHPSYDQLLQEQGSNSKIYAYLNGFLDELRAKRSLQSVHQLTNELHMWPDYHGNRSPLADPNLKGMICGLTMTNGVEQLALTYLALMQALAYGTRQILEALRRSGREPISSILLCGGLSKNALFVQTHADVCAVPVLLPNEPEAVLLGSAMTAACAAGFYCDLLTAASSMGGDAAVVKPDLSVHVRDYHSKKFEVFSRMYADQRNYERIMKE